MGYVIAIVMFLVLSLGLKSSYYLFKFADYLTKNNPEDIKIAGLDYGNINGFKLLPYIFDKKNINKFDSKGRILRQKTIKSIKQVFLFLILVPIIIFVFILFLS